jgi:putative flavoprotein involved in K+ transport
MTSIETVVIGAGHAGLAVSRLLTDAGREHLVLERGRVAERWRTQRWDSLRLLTPNWMTRLPGQRYEGRDPDGFMQAAAFVERLERYAVSFTAPVLANTTVLDVRAASSGGYQVSTEHGGWHAKNVVVATGPHGVPRWPAGLDARDAITVDRYRNPRQLAPGGVLVVGASASGAQIADELTRAGREVVLAVGRHTRLPRVYRGLDIFRWLERTGKLARTIDDVVDPVAARREPSAQLVGRLARFDATGCDIDGVDLAALQSRGVRLVGRFEGMSGGRARFRTDLVETVNMAQHAMNKVLDAIDEHIEATGLTGHVPPARRPPSLRVPPSVEALDRGSAQIGAVLVATGFRPDYPWLRLPITDRTGTIQQRRGVTPAPGVYVVGQRFQHRRDSGFIDGARHDALAVVRHMTAHCPPRADDAQGEEPAA